MELTNLLEQLLAGESLSPEAAGEAISAVMGGELTPAQIAALLTALRAKGETIDEIVGAAKAMRAHAASVQTKRTGILDTCGTGGDKSGSFNISTTSALTCAGVGVPVAKHGNRSATSQCGSIDLLEKLGVDVMIDPARIGACLDEVGIGVLFARTVHPAMKHAAPIRSELGFRTIFNFLGPLTNPATPDYQLVGISDPSRLETYATCLQKLGIQRAWVVCGSDGMDEITLSGPTNYIDVTPNALTPGVISPEQAGLQTAPMDELKGGTPEDNVQITKDILVGKDKGHRRDAVLLNAGAALTVAGKALSLNEGISLAAESLDSGKAAEILEKLIQFTNA